MRLLGRAVLLPFTALFVLAVAALVIAGMGIYGASLATVATVLILVSRRFREWLKRQPGYQYRLKLLRFWEDYSTGRMAFSVLFYLLPMALLCAAALVLLVRTPLAFLVVAVAGMAGIAILYLDMVAGMGLASRQAHRGAEPSGIWQFCSGHKFATTCILLGTAVPVTAVAILAMSIWLPRTSAAGVDQQPSLPQGIYLLPSPDSRKTAVPGPAATATGTPAPTTTPLPSPTSTSTATVTATAEPLPPFHDLTPFPTVTPSPPPLDAAAPEGAPFLPPPIRSS